MPNRKNQNGFTLIELLIVLVVLSLLAVVVLIALDPLRQFAEARNVKRWTHVQNLSTAVYRYIIEKSAYPPGISDQEQQLGTATTGCNEVCSNAGDSCLDLSASLKEYLDSIPFDPNKGSPEKTYYSIVKNDNNVITIKACNAENDTEIYLSR